MRAAAGEGVGELVAVAGDVHAEDFGRPGAGEGVAGFEGEIGAVEAGVGACFRPGDAERAGGVGDGGQRGGTAGVAGAAEEVFDAIRHAVLIMIRVEVATDAVAGLPIRERGRDAGGEVAVRIEREAREAGSADLRELRGGQTVRVGAKTQRRA